MTIRPVHIAVLVAATVLPAAFTLDPAFDHDVWWHLRVGQLVSETGSVPDTDSFSRLGREQPTPWVAYSWLFEWGLYQTYARLGPAGVLWARTLLGALSTAAVFGLIVGRGPLSWRSLVAVGLAAVTLMPLMKERPWHLTIAFTAWTVAAVDVLRAGAPVRRFAWLPLLFALWANLHIQFVLGWLVLGLACLFPGRADRRWLVLLTAGCVAAVAANPYHVRLLGVVWEYATQTGPLRTVQELAPPDPRTPWPWAALALLGWAALVSGRRRPTDRFGLALLAAGLVLSLRMRRDVWFAAVAAGGALRHLGSCPLPPCGGGLGWGVDRDRRRELAPPPRPSPTRGEGERQTLIAPARGATVFGMVFATFVGVRLLNLAGVGPPSDPDAANARRFPVAAVAFAREHDLPGPLFNSFDWGGYLIWALRDRPVSIDGRTNLYGSERVGRAMRTWTGEPGWDVDSELLSAKLVVAPRQAPLTALLRERPEEWRVAFEDGTAVVFVRGGR